MMVLQELKLKEMLETNLKSPNTIEKWLNLIDLSTDVKTSVKQYFVDNPLTITFVYPYQNIQNPTIAINLVNENFVPMTLGHRAERGYIEYGDYKQFSTVGDGTTTRFLIPNEKYVDQNHFAVEYAGKTYKFPEQLQDIGKKEQYIDPQTNQLAERYVIPFFLLPNGLEFYEAPPDGELIIINYFPIEVYGNIHTRFLRKTFSLSILTNNELVTVVLFHIVKTILLKDFLYYLEANGGYDISLQSAELIADERLLPAGWYSRKITISFFVEEKFEIPPMVDGTYPPSTIPTEPQEGVVATTITKINLDKNS